MSEEMRQEAPQSTAPRDAQEPGDLDAQGPRRHRESLAGLLKGKAKVLFPTAEALEDAIEAAWDRPAEEMLDKDAE
jgi:hypothetical protein